MAAVVGVCASPALDCLWHGRGRLQEWHQCDLGTDPDQQQQERIDDEGGVQRFEVFHRAPPSMLGGPSLAINNPHRTGYASDAPYRD